MEEILVIGTRIDDNPIRNSHLNLFFYSYLVFMILILVVCVELLLRRSRG